MLLATGPANIIYLLQQFWDNITIVLRCRLTTHIGTGAHNRLLEAITEFLAERLESYSHGKTAILCHQIIGYTRSIIKDDGSWLHRHGYIDEIPSHLRHIAEITRHTVCTIHQTDKRLTVVALLYFVNLCHCLWVGSVTTDTPNGICRIENHSTLAHAFYCILNIFLLSHFLFSFIIKYFCTARYLSFR